MAKHRSYNSLSPLPTKPAPPPRTRSGGTRPPLARTSSGRAGKGSERGPGAAGMGKGRPRVETVWAKYHLVLVFSLMGSVQVSYAGWSSVEAWEVRKEQDALHEGDFGSKVMYTWFRVNPKTGEALLP